MLEQPKEVRDLLQGGLPIAKDRVLPIPRWDEVVRSLGRERRPVRILAGLAPVLKNLSPDEKSYAQRSLIVLNDFCYRRRVAREYADAAADEKQEVQDPAPTRFDFGSVSITLPEKPPSFEHVFRVPPRSKEERLASLFETVLSIRDQNRLHGRVREFPDNGRKVAVLSSELSGSGAASSLVYHFSALPYSTNVRVSPDGAIRVHSNDANDTYYRRLQRTLWNLISDEERRIFFPRLNPVPDGDFARRPYFANAVNRERGPASLYECLFDVVESFFAAKNLTSDSLFFETEGRSASTKIVLDICGEAVSITENCLTVRITEFVPGKRIPANPAGASIHVIGGRLQEVQFRDRPGGEEIYFPDRCAAGFDNNRMEKIHRSLDFYRDALIRHMETRNRVPPIPAVEPDWAI